MTLVTELLVSGPTLPLVDVAASLPTPEIDLVHAVRVDGEHVLFVVSVADDSHERFETVVSQHDEVSAVTPLGETTDGWFYQVRYERLPSFFEAFDPQEFEGVLTQATITGDGYREDKVFSDYEAFNRLREHCGNHGVSLQLLSIDSDPAGDPQRQFGLTERQREALELALSHGYYESPRGVSTTELGEKLGISAASTSELLRRAEQTLISEALDLEGTVDTLLS